MPVTRVRDLASMPTLSLRCTATSRHVGFFDDPTVSDSNIGGWGRRDARLVTYRCDCGRTKREVIDWDTGETLTRSAAYDGGTLPHEPARAHDARITLLRRYVDTPAERITRNGRKPGRKKVGA